MKTSYSVLRTSLLSVVCLFWVPTVVWGQLEGFSVTNAFGNLSFNQPLCLQTPPGETNRLFVLEKPGMIAVITNLASPNRTVFMDLTAQVDPNGEGGLLGLAFHPGYSSNGTFFCYYTTRGGFRDRLARFQVSPTDPNQAPTNSQVVLIDQVDEASNHNGGSLHFGPDGYLYLSMGDEGGGNDAYANSQRLDKDFFAGIIRIDVDMKPGSLPPNPHPSIALPVQYAIPADNPYIGFTEFNGMPLNTQNLRTEFWAVGLRNPWRMSFDRETGRLYVGDVGQGLREEIDVIEPGGNYGWAYREGLAARPGSPTPPAEFSAIDPIQDYGREAGPTGGTSVTGGVVYRGSEIPSLYGYYVFADYNSGNIWALYHDGTNTIPYQRIAGEGGIAGFGEDPRNGDVLMADLGNGPIRRLVHAETSALFVDVVQAGATWSYLDDGSDQMTAWREPAFDDSAWPAGPAELGNGDNDEATPINIGPIGDRFHTLYFRHAFEVPDPSIYSSLVVDLLRDDGGVVYLNGQEVFRSNMPGGTITADTFASSVTANADETTYFSMGVDPALLVPGTNVLAVEIHQSDAGSSDISFNLRLSGAVDPELSIADEGATVVLSWPAPAPGFILQNTEVLGSDSWDATGLPVVREGMFNKVTYVKDSETRFFRLERVQPLVITAGPTPQAVNGGTDVTFSVLATGNLPLQYQWLFEGEPLVGETASTLLLTNVAAAQSGVYRVEITDAAGQTAAAEATLSVLEPASFVMHPQSLTVMVGEDATFTVTSAGTLPMGYRWRRDFATLTGYATNSHTTSITLTNVQLSDSGLEMTVVLTNAVTTIPGILSQAAVLTVIDGAGGGEEDGDGAKPATP